MKIFGYTCILFVVLYVIDLYKRILDDYLGILLMDCAYCLKFFRSNFGCGFLVFRCFRQLFWGLGLYVLFGLGLKFLEFGLQCWGFMCLCVLGGVWSELRTGFSSKSDFDMKTISKFLENPLMIEDIDVNKECENDVDDEDGSFDEDEEFDVVKLRKLVKVERDRANAVYAELEKERMAAATAAEETMAMILRLQNEKSVIEMEAHQYRRMAEEKQLHDQEVINSLRWIAMRCESAEIQLEDQVRLLKEKVELLLDDEEDQSGGFDNFEDAFNNRLVSSLDLGLSSCVVQSDDADECPFEAAWSGESNLI